MDQGTRDVEMRAAADARRAANPEREPSLLEHEVDVSRARLGDLVGELERRGRKARTPAIAIAAGAAALAIAGVIVWPRFVRPRYARLRFARRSRARILQDMWRRAAKHPERVAAESPNVALKILGAAGSAAAAAGTRALMKRWLRA